ncbi:MAG: TRAP transporter substrate-binding protein [Proteobacteria bacterium]|nr:TRAP transporter substrate-binding protein [Pseudomonadota bacterium]
MKKWLAILIVVAVGVTLLAAGAFAAEKENPMAKWNPDFDPSTAQYKIIYSNVSNPGLKGVYTGIAIRDELWKRTGGKMYFDYRPFSMLGGETEVFNLLQTGTIQGMASSSVAAPQIGPGFGLANLPFLLDTYENLDKFVADKELMAPFLDSAKHQGIMGVNLSGYGQYGWASTKPIRKLEDLKKVKLRIAEAPVNLLTYKAWGINPVPMPWPDVPVALKQGVIDALDHTGMVCMVTKKFEVCKYFTEINYAQGLFIWLLNEKWFNDLKAKEPELAKTLIDVMNEKCNEMRAATLKQQEAMYQAAKEKEGVEFIKLSDADMKELRRRSVAVHNEYADKIGPEYLKKVQKLLGFEG